MIFIRVVVTLLPLLTYQGFSQGDKTRTIPAGFCITVTEMKLYYMINQYRSGYNLPPVPLSRSLCYVATKHVKDLYYNHPDNPPCNFHSWSDKGNWKPFCYPRDEKKNHSVWDKPKELTDYKGKGYEIVYWENSAVTIDSIIPFWQSIDYFNSFLLNTGKWQGSKWQSIGIGIFENYAVAWFGEITDPDGEPFICGSETQTMQKANPEKPSPLPAPAVKPAQKTALNAPSFHIIVKSQQPLDVMNQALDEMKKKGYNQAQLIKKDNKLRLSIMSFPERSMADSAIREVRKSVPDAWIFRY